MIYTFSKEFEFIVGTLFLGALIAITLVLVGVKKDVNLLQSAKPKEVRVVVTATPEPTATISAKPVLLKKVVPTIAVK